MLLESLEFLISSRRKEMHKRPRNQLIALLAASDLLLSVTMPFTAVDGLTKFW
jgi:hypothetical protein